MVAGGIVLEIVHLLVTLWFLKHSIGMGIFLS